MCGIAGFHVKHNAKGKLPVGKMLNHLLLGIESRGPEATGFLSVSFDREIQLDKAPMTAKKFIKKRKKLKGDVQTVIAHTRLATQGSPQHNENNHPVQFKTTFVVHNGMVWNDTQLINSYGWDPKAEVDSIVIPALINELGFDNVDKAMEKFDGYAAIAAVDVEHPGRVILARGNNSPLVWIETDQFIAWASSTDALRRMWGACFGTPPAFDKFTLAAEGTLIDIENGEVDLYGFDPMPFVYSGYTSYTGGFQSGRGWQDDDWTDTGWGVKSIPATKGSSGSNLPSLKTIDMVSQYREWAEIDNMIHERTIEHLAHELNLDMETMCWLVKNAEDTIIRGDKNLDEVRRYALSRYEDIYDACLKAGSKKGNECLICSDPIPHSVKYCPSCAQISKTDDYKPGDLLKEALKTKGTAEEVIEYVQEKTIERRQAIAELTTGNAAETRLAV